MVARDTKNKRAIAALKVLTWKLTGWFVTLSSTYAQDKHKVKLIEINLKL